MHLEGMLQEQEKAMTYLLKVRLIKPGIVSVDEKDSQDFMMHRKVDAAILIWQHKQQLPLDLDMQVEFYEVDYDRKRLVQLENVPEVIFK